MRKPALPPVLIVVTAAEDISLSEEDAELHR